MAIKTAEELADELEAMRCTYNTYYTQLYESWREQRNLLSGLYHDSEVRVRHVHAPEDEVVRALCERIGYGAVMDAAARLWRQKDPCGAFVVGPTLCELRKALEEPQ